MAKGNNQKIKLIKLLEILRNYSDENHPISTNDLIFKLQEFGIDVERKTLYDDIKILNAWGYEILCDKQNHSNCYFIVDRKFDLPELKILLDAVESANFITPKKTKDLVGKIADQAGSYKAEILKKTIYFDTLKHSNEKIYYSIDTINDAIIKQKKVSFLYFDFNTEGGRVYRKNSERYIVSPVLLSFSENNYYLTSFNDKYNDFANYRIDKMDSVLIENMDIENKDTKSLLVLNNPKRAFSMFLGKEEKVTIKLDNELVGAVMDKFGEKVKMTKIDDEHFKIQVFVQISPTFFSWCFSFGDKMKVVEPASVVEQLKENLHILANMYK